MPRMIGFMATWTTYGTWLQGDKRGYVKNATVLEPNEALEKSNEELLKHEKVKIPKSIREIVKNAILKEAAAMNQNVYAIAVQSNHVHIVVESIGRTCGYSVGRFKKSATIALRKHGFSGKIWSKGFDKRYCYHRSELEAKIEYVEKHQ